MAPSPHQPEESSGHDPTPASTLGEYPPPAVAPAGAGPAPAPPAGTSAAGSLPAPAATPVDDTTDRDEPSLVVPRTRTSAAYAGVAVGLLVLVLIVVFIAQNLGDASVHFITLHFRLPIGLLILASVVAGGILVLVVSAARVAQLRLMARRHRAGKPTN